MRIPIVTGGAVVLLAALAPQAFAVEGAPLRNRDGVVVSWQAGSKSAVVITRDSRVYVVHSLRKISPGTRVRVQGVKWGTPVQGVKWGTQPAGVKWGIKLARNGTFQSSLVKLGKSSTMALRATVVKKYGNRGVAVSVNGAVVVLPVTRRAVWLPGGKLTKAGTGVGQFGSKSVFRIRVDSKGRAIVTGATEVAPATPAASVPFAGSLQSVDAANGTIVVNSSANKLLPLSLTITVPAKVDLTKFAVGTQVSGAAVASVADPNVLIATALSSNASFTAADNPSTSVIIPAPNPEHLAAIAAMRADWKAGFDSGKFTQQGNGLYTSQTNQLLVVERAIVRSDVSQAVRKLNQFIELLGKANDNGPLKVDPAFKDTMILKAQAVRVKITPPGGLYDINGHDDDH